MADQPGPATEPTKKPAGPGVGHFLPDGAGAGGPAADKPAERGAAPLAAPTPRLRRVIDEDAAPQLSGSRLDGPGLAGSRLGTTPGQDAAAAYRAVYHPEPIPFDPNKKRSKALVAGVVAAVLLVVGGIVYGGAMLLTKSDGLLANPLTTPSVRGTESPKGPIRKGVSDADVLAKNPIYAAGSLGTVKCKELTFRPTTSDSIYSYYEAMIGCLDNAWKPLVTKAGFEFRSPKLVIFDEGQDTACGVLEEVASYCDSDGGSVALPWQVTVDDYQKNKAATRIDMAQSIAFAYGVHVQKLTGIFESSGNVHDQAKDKAAALEQARRQSLQANCFAAAFVGATQQSFPISGELKNQWIHVMNHTGDENTKEKVHDHGSVKSHATWMGRGWTKHDPGTCNTFGAPAAEVG